jgi:hypothetical protein
MCCVHHFETEAYLNCILKYQFLTQRKHVYISNINLLMLYREIIAVCFEIHAKIINILWANYKVNYMLKQAVHT